MRFLKGAYCNGYFNAMGKFSYSFYLIHPIVMTAVTSASPKGVWLTFTNSLYYANANILLCFVFAMAVWVLVARPIQQCLKHTVMPLLSHES